MEVACGTVTTALALTWVKAYMYLVLGETDKAADLLISMPETIRDAFEIGAICGAIAEVVSMVISKIWDKICELFGKAKEYVLDARVKGGERHMIMSGEYDSVMPMDIYPEYLIKAIITGNIDKMEQLGIYEIAPEDFALAEFACTSKLELQAIIRKGLDRMRAEMV